MRKGFLWRMVSDSRLRPRRVRLGARRELNLALTIFLLTVSAFTAESRRITALRALEGPGIEFLEYLTPHDGRPFPADSRADDVLCWQTQMTVADTEMLARMLSDAKASIVSPGVVEGFEGNLGFQKGLLVRDRDGHALEIVQH